MLENILGELAGTQKVFATFALAGTLFFILRVILIFFTGVGDTMQPERTAALEHAREFLRWVAAFGRIESDAH